MLGWRKEGMKPSHHDPYALGNTYARMGGTKGHDLPWVRWLQKPVLGSDCRLQLASMKQKSLVIASSYAAANPFSGSYSYKYGWDLGRSSHTLSQIFPIGFWVVGHHYQSWPKTSSARVMAASSRCLKQINGNKSPPNHHQKAAHLRCGYSSFLRYLAAWPSF